MIEGHVDPDESHSANSDDNQLTMAELINQQEKFFRVIKPGEIVKGTVARKRGNEILIDVGAKSEGIVDIRDFDNLSPEEIAEIEVGACLPVYILSVEGEENYINLSLSKARIERDWDNAKLMFENEDVIETEVIGNNKGGLLVNFGQIRGFVPGSQLINAHQYGGSSQRPGSWNQMLGEQLRLKIIEVDRERNRLIMSERAAAAEAHKEKAKFLSSLKDGDILNGRVTNLAKFGAFVDIGGIDGLIHLSELAWTHILHPRELLKAGDEIEVFILSVDLEQQRVALSLKRLTPEPWSNVFDHYQINEVKDAVITKLTDFGAFARIDDYIEGLIHISEISDKNVSHPRNVLAEKQKLQVRIIHIDPERQRMGLSIRQVDGYEEWLSFKEEEEEKAEEPNSDDTEE